VPAGKLKENKLIFFCILSARFVNSYRQLLPQNLLRLLLLL
jgi:hypothetical protein